METRWKRTLCHLSYPVSPPNSLFFLWYLFCLCLITSIILSGHISFTLFLPFFILSLLFNFIFPLWMNSMDCFAWSLCQVLHYLREYLYLFSFFLMLKLYYSTLSDSLVTPFYICLPPLLSITPIFAINFFLPAHNYECEYMKYCHQILSSLKCYTWCFCNRSSPREWLLLRQYSNFVETLGTESGYQQCSLTEWNCISTLVQTVPLIIANTSIYKNENINK